MKEIKLTGKHGIGKVALVDDEDYEKVNKFKWSAVKSINCFYGKGCVNGTPIFMHNFIKALHKQVGLFDHWNRNGLDNRKQNLRKATNSQNAKNRQVCKNNISGYKGVHYNRRQKSYTATIKSDGISYHIGVFKTPEEAALAYNQKAKELHKEFAYLNIIR